MLKPRRVDILLVEDNLGDIKLITEALADTDGHPEIHCVRDGIEAMQFLRRETPYENAPRPTIIILDLNLPRKNGRVVLAEIKSDSTLAPTPVIVLSGSDAPQDIATCYALHANCYIIKPRDLFGLTDTIHCLVDFWLKKVRLPFDDSKSENHSGVVK